MCVQEVLDRFSLGSGTNSSLVNLLMIAAMSRAGARYGVNADPKAPWVPSSLLWRRYHGKGYNPQGNFISNCLMSVDSAQYLHMGQRHSKLQPCISI
jgi:hypothetical protein